MASIGMLESKTHFAQFVDELVAGKENEIWLVNISSV